VLIATDLIVTTFKCFILSYFIANLNKSYIHVPVVIVDNLKSMILYFYFKSFDQNNPSISFYEIVLNRLAYILKIWIESTTFISEKLLFYSFSRTNQIHMSFVVGSYFNVVSQFIVTAN
jgi:hypothetical protein